MEKHKNLVILGIVSVATGAILLTEIHRTSQFLVNNIQTTYAAVNTSLKLSPASTAVDVSQNFSIDIMLDTGGENIDGVDIHSLHFDPSKLQVMDSDLNQPGVQVATGGVLPIAAYNLVDNTTGTIQLSLLPNSGSTYSGAGRIATISFHAVSAGTTNIYFDFTLGNSIDTNVAVGGYDQLSVIGNAAITISALPVADTSAPTAPTRFSVSSPNYTQVNLSWRASTDNVGVAGYEIYRNNVLIGKVPAGVLNYSDFSVVPQTTYSYAVRAYDAAGNFSAFTTVKSVTVPAPKAPSISNIKATEATAGSPVVITWSTDVSTTGAVSYSVAGTVTPFAVSDNNISRQHTVSIPSSSYASGTSLSYIITATLPSPYQSFISTSRTKNIRLK